MDVIPNSQNLFKTLGDKHNTDKVDTHRYHPIYERYLKFLREKTDLRVLEIGLGCNMPYGAGHSIPVWREYFPKLEALFVVEFARDCALKFMDKVDEMFIGDQSDIPFMKSVGKKAGPLDIIVDDGGHTMKQMRNSLIALFSSVRPGGLYFIEDILCEYMDNYRDNGNDTIMTLLHEIMDVKHDTHKKRKHSKEATILAPMVEYVECWTEICVLVRKM